MRRINQKREGTIVEPAFVENMKKVELRLAVVKCAREERGDPGSKVVVVERRKKKNCALPRERAREAERALLSLTTVHGGCESDGITFALFPCPSVPRVPPALLSFHQW